MDIVFEKTGDLTANLVIKLTEEDYAEKVQKELKDMQKKAQMPGFRPGKVPFGMIKKMYGKNVLVEEVNKVLVDSMYDYIKKEELNVLGNPLPDNEKTKQIDWDKDTEFEFVYELGLAPDINLSLSDDIEVEYHKIKADDSAIDETIADLQKRYGSFTSPEESGEDDILKGDFEELDGDGNVIEDGLKNESDLYVKYIKDDDTKKSFTGIQPGESRDIDIQKSVENETEMANILGVNKEELGQYSNNYRFTLKSITRVEPAPLNEEFFAKVAPEQEIKEEQAFRDFVGEQLEKQYQADVDKNFKNEAVKTLLEKADLSLPEEFLKRWLLESNKENKEITPEQVENEFVSFSDSFKWQLIENYLIKEHNLEVKPEEVNEYLRNFMRQQLKQYGQNDPGEEVLDDFVKRIASNQDEVKKVYDQLFDVKVVDLLKKELKLKEKELTFNEFVNEMTEKYKNKNANVNQE